MMLRRWPAPLLCLLLGAVGAVCAANGLTSPASIPAAVAAGPAAGAEGEVLSIPEKLFANATVFNGTLGEQKIQASLRQKEDMREGLEGEYFLFGSPHKILLAGEFDHDGAIFLEESENGRTVSGQWDGKLDGDTFAGTWSSFDGAVSKPFLLKVIPAKVRLPLERMTRSTKSNGARKN